MDAAGTVVAIGDAVTRFAVGDEVIAMLGSRFGGHAELAVIDADAAVAPKPRRLGFEEAAALVFGGITAEAFLRQTTVGADTRVLVNGASGAVGSSVVQLAHAAGAHVTAVTSAGNTELVRSLGADEVIDYRADDFAAGGRTWDVVVDAVGNAPVRRIHPSVARGGAALLIAAGLRSLLTASRDSRRYGITVVTAPGEYRADDLRTLASLADQGMLRPVIDRDYGLDDIVEAHRYVDSGRKRGAVVVRVAQEGRRSAAAYGADKSTA
jgi:NADPH:quinone reductase-like Zn-dependent oxidoreductase